MALLSLLGDVERFLCSAFCLFAVSVNDCTLKNNSSLSGLISVIKKINYWLTVGFRS